MSLDQFYTDLEKCDKCPTKGHTTKEKGWGVPGKILFVGQCPAPSSIDKKEGESDFDKFFISLLEEVGVSKNDFFFTNLVKSPMSSSTMGLLTREELDHWYDHLDEEIGLIRPKVIVTLGKFSGAWGASRREKHQCKIIDIQHPSFLYYNPGIRSTYLKHLGTIKLFIES